MLGEVARRVPVPVPTLRPRVGGGAGGTRGRVGVVGRTRVGGVGGIRGGVGVVGRGQRRIPVVLPACSATDTIVA
ncbi:hypothetical protein CBOVI_03450 [Corynebacterium bovis DSM 20582 = CIP 54.80]|uniref:Uncharacterized protein n=1 Tax=Corynebacterium bovis DSM 20582 = CIP 54.80 TaxID=927655 RepID=A0A8H9YCS5_9CORY|nr:hypothetical protein [Corynebacterium bovis DSM 20582 = CIP 54.80]WJY77224.1 hypothetical protein CBOVI_03450 [Corynebacterium bovis DSM 20582 = CIP 54.80]